MLIYNIELTNRFIYIKIAHDFYSWAIHMTPILQEITQSISGGVILSAEDLQRGFTRSTDPKLVEEARKKDGVYWSITGLHRKHPEDTELSSLCHDIFVPNSCSLSAKTHFQMISGPMSLLLGIGLGAYLAFAKTT